MSVERSAPGAVSPSNRLNVERSASSDADNPWPGLATFTEEQSGLFHGRDEEIRDLTRRAEGSPLTVLFGQSGLGKSSLLLAGVFPRLRARGYWPVYVRLDHGAGAPPPAEQIKLLVRAETARAGTWTKPGAAQPGESLWEFFHHRDDRLVTAGGRSIVPVLVFDQFEELFTLGAGSGSERARAVAFMSELAELVENRPSERLVARLEESSAEMDAFDFSRTDYRVVITLREDYLPQLETLKTTMPALMDNRMRLARMNGAQALEAVVKPGGALVTEEVARAIVEFVAGARGGSTERLAELDVEPPLLSVICRELNDRRRALGHAQITADLVTGNRREILHDFYERSVADLPAGMRAFVEDHLLTKSGYRDNLALETALEFPGVTQPLIDTLVSRRLLRIEDRLGVQRVELTHDVLAEVIRASRDARQQRLALEQAREREQRVLAAAAQRTRKLRWLVAGLTAIVIALCLGGLYGLRARQQEFARSSRLDGEIASRLLEEGKTSDGLAYLLRAARKDPKNASIAPRLASLLTSRNFFIPETAPIEHASAVVASRYSLDGKSLAVFWQDGTWRRIELATGRVEEGRFEDAKPGSYTKNFGLVPYANNSLAVISLETGEVVRTVQFPGAIRIVSLARKASDYVAVGLADKTAIWCDATTGRFIGEPIPVPPPDAGNGNGYFISGGDWLAWGESHTLIRVRHAVTGATVVLNATPGATFFDFFVSPTGQQMITVEDPGLGRPRFMRRWSLPAGAPLGAPQPLAGTGAGGWPYYSDDGHFIVTWYSNLEIFEAETGRRIALLIDAGSSSGTPLFSPDGRTMATALVGVVSLWDLATGQPRVPPIRHRGSARAVEFSADGGAILTVCSDGFARLWDTSTGRLLAEPTLQQRGQPSAAVSRDGQQVAVGTGTGGLYRFNLGRAAATSLTLARTPPFFPAPFLPGDPARFWWMRGDRALALDIASGREVPGGIAYPESILGVGAQAGGAKVRDDLKVMVVRTEAGVWKAWWLDEGKIEREVILRDAPDATASVVFSRAGDLVSLGWLVATNNLRAWSLQTGQPSSPALTASPGVIQYRSFSPDGQRLTAPTPDNLAAVWEVVTGRELFKLTTASGQIRGAFFNPDGTRIVTTHSRGEAQLWDATTGRPVVEPLFHNDGVYGAVFSTDGNRLATYSNDGWLRLWHGRTGEPAGEPIESSGNFRNARFNRDGTRLLTASADGTARIWDAATSLPVSEPMRHDANTRVADAQFSPDERFVMTESSDNKYRLWSVPPPLPANAATPGWLLDLAAICAGKIVTAEGRFQPAPDALAKIDDVRRTLAALPADAPYVEWGRWFLADRATRSIAPGFTITPAEAEKLAKEMAAAAK